jgi:O-succinylbenzoate synthase
LPDQALDLVELRILRLPLRRPFVTALGATSQRDVLLVRVVTVAGAEGWGECAAETVPRYWHETVESAEIVLRRWLAPAVLAGPVTDFPVEGLAQRAGVVGHPMAAAALEMALLDARLRSTGTSLADHLASSPPPAPVAPGAGTAEGPWRPRSNVPATFTAGLDDDPLAAVAAGYRSVKLKLAGLDGIDRLAALAGDVRRAGAGTAIEVSADANGSLAALTGEDPGHRALGRLDAIGLSHLEQPLAADDLVGHARLVGRLATPVCLDESASSAGAVEAALALRAAGAVCVKASRLGGLAAARRVHDACVAAGVQAKVGGMLETGIGRAAALALAALPGFTLPPDLSASDRYWAPEAELTEPVRLGDGGHLAVPNGAGLGVQVRAAVVEASTVSVASIRPG